MALNRDLKRKRAGMAKEWGLSPPIVCTVFGKRRAVEADTLIFNSKTRESQKVKHVNVEVFSWLKQQHSCVGHATKVVPFTGKCTVREQLSNHQKRTLFGLCMLDLTFLSCKMCD